jgi:ribulose-5-phosphate 4-epimerase/fuculose-1-phosphate aldolase
MYNEFCRRGQVQQNSGDACAGMPGPRYVAKVTGKSLILRNHALQSVGHTVDEAAWWFITMDRSCQAQLLAEAAGQPVLINRECALATRQQVGAHETG